MRARPRSAALTLARALAHRVVLVPFVHSIVRLRVTGRDHLRSAGPLVVVANHSSHLDAPVLFTALPRRTTRHLATAAAADYFFASRWRSWPTILWFNAIPVARDGDRTHAGLARGALEQGSSLLVFPEGGRARGLGRSPFKPGAAALAISCGVPCLPVALIGAREAMPRGARWPRRGRPRIDVVIGAPILPLPGEDAEALSLRLAAEVDRLSGASASPSVHDTPPPPSKGTSWTTEAPGRPHRHRASRGPSTSRGPSASRGPSTPRGQRPWSA